MMNETKFHTVGNMSQQQQQQQQQQLYPPQHYQQQQQQQQHQQHQPSQKLLSHNTALRTQPSLFLSNNNSQQQQNNSFNNYYQNNPLLHHPKGQSSLTSTSSSTTTAVVDLKCHRIAPVARSSRQQSDITAATYYIAHPYHYHHKTQHYCPTSLYTTNYQQNFINYTPQTILNLHNNQQQARPYYQSDLASNHHRGYNCYYNDHSSILTTTPAYQSQSTQQSLLPATTTSTTTTDPSYNNQISIPSVQPQAKPMSAQTPSAIPEAISPGPKLIWLLFMHRHGDRAPLNMAPRDKYNNITYWAEGFGNLNNAGRMRMFKLGKFIRRRYDGFLSDNIREVYSRSSDVDRCIESSHALLAGLYPPTNRFEWNKELLWLPAPVHTVPAPEDYLLNEAGRKFLMEVINEIHLIQNSEAVKKLYEESVNERELLERELGYEYDMFYKFKCTYSTLDIEERNGLIMPAWYTPELKQKLYRFAGIAFGLAGGGTEKLKKIRCGHLLEDIVSRMELSSIEGPKLKDQSEFNQPTNSPSEIDARRIIHYSTHDSIMAAFLESLNINSPTPVPPGFGATFFIELYVDLNEQGLPVSEKYVKLFYMDDTDTEKPIEKKLPNARLNENGQLTLNNFRKYIQDLLPSNIVSCNM